MNEQILSRVIGIIKDNEFTDYHDLIDYVFDNPTCGVDYNDLIDILTTDLGIINCYIDGNEVDI